MAELPKKIRRLDNEVRRLADRGNDGETVNELARIGCHLLETSRNALSEVPEVDLKALEACISVVRSSLGDRLREPPEEKRRGAHVLDLGWLRITVSAERIPAESEEQA